MKLGGPVVKNPSKAGETGSIPGWGTKIPHASGQLSPHPTTIELTHLNETARILQTIEPMQSGACTPQLQSPHTLEPCAPQLEKENPHATTREKPKHYT